MTKNKIDTIDATIFLFINPLPVLCNFDKNEYNKMMKILKDVETSK